MDVDDEVVGVDVEEVLAVGVGALQHLPVDELGVEREPALRRRHGHLVPHEAPRVGLREAADGVAFGHRVCLPGAPPTHSSGSAGGTPVCS